MIVQNRRLAAATSRAARPADRRRSLKLGSILGGGVLALAGLSAAPAMAQDECGAAPIGGGDVTCTTAGNPYPNGISYFTPDALTVNLDDGVAVDTSGTLNVGVLLFDFGAAEFTLNGAGASVTTDSDGGFGILSATNVGDINLNIGSVTTSGENGIGIIGSSADGNIAIDAGTVSTIGDGAGAVQGTTNTGDISIDTFTVTTSGANADGVFADSDNGDIDIVSSTVITEGDASRGVSADTTFGDITIGNGGDSIITSGATSDAIFANTSNGDVSVDIFQAQTSGVNSDAIEATSRIGAVTVNATAAATDGDGSRAIVASGESVMVTSSGFFVATGGDNANAIQVRATNGDASVNVGNAFTAGDNSTGIDIASLGGAVTVDAGALTTSGTNSAGVLATSGTAGNIFFGIPSAVGGLIDVSGSSIRTGGANSVGVMTNAAFGADTTIDVGEVTTSGDNSTAVMARSAVDGSIDITADNVTTNGELSRGIDAETTGTGDIAITAGSVVTNGLSGPSFFFLPDGSAIRATTVSGDIVVTADTVSTQGASAEGIDAQSQSGDILVDVGSASTTGAGANGITALINPLGIAGGGGAIDVSADTVTTTGDNSVGILASSTAGGTASVDAGSVTTSGFAARGIEAFAFGDVDVSYDSVTTNNLFATGVQASSDTGNVTVTGGTLTTNSEVVTGIDAFTAGPGNVLVDVDTVTTTGNGSAAGIAASSTSGNVTVNADNVSTVGDSLFGGTSVGILAQSDTGAVLINAGRVTATGVGTGAIQASTTGAGPITVNTSGVVSSAQGTAILLDSGGTARVAIAAGSSVNGAVAGIDSTSVDGTTILNSGTVGSTAGFAIDADGGSATITNSGIVNGAVDLTDNADVFTNSAAGRFNAVGTSNFGAGADNFANAGLLTAFSSATFNGLETFGNTGLIDLRDGATGDVLTLAGTAFNGGTGSQLGLDVNLANGTADRLVIGAASGTTSLLLANANPGGVPNLNLTGILLVDATSATAGNFVLSGQTDFGFNRVGLRFDTATSNFLLVTAPDTEAFELGRTGVAVTNSWNQSADAWSARMTELRDVAWSGAQPRNDGFEMWAQGYGGSEGQDQVRSFTLGGITSNADLSYDQEYFGFQFGGDVQRTLGSATVVYGFTGGVAASELELASGNHIDLRGGNIGLYAAANAGGFFVNGLVKADQFEVTVTSKTAFFREEVDGTSYGAKAEVGYHAAFGSFFVEPVATLAYSDADIDDVTVPGGVFDFDDLKSLRGEAGVRMGGTFGSASGMRYQPFVGVFAVEEFEGNGLTTFTSGTTVFGNQEIEPDTYGKVSLGMNVLDQNGVNLFVRGDAAFAGDATGGSVRVGARWSF